MTSFRPVFAALLVSFLVTACGGGGSGTSAPPPLPADLQTSVPTPTSADLQALNTLRGQLGLGLLMENSRLLTVAEKHANYLNSGFGGRQLHSDGGTQFWSTEDNPNYPGFSGVTANDRCQAIGYSGICNDVATYENIEGTIPPDMWWIGNLYELLARPYGGIMIFTQAPRDAGVFRVGGLGFLTTPYTISLHFGIPTSGGQRQGSGFVLAYPLPDSSVPNLSFGHAINLHINAGETLTVDSFTLLDKNGSTVEATLMTQATDPEKFVPGHVAVLVPNAPLVAGMNYTVNFWGKRNGTRFSRFWNFSVSNFPPV